MSLEKMSFEELLSMAHGMLIMGKQIPDDLADYMSDRFMESIHASWEPSKIAAPIPSLSVSAPYPAKAYVRCSNVCFERG